jgi:uncharacterized protein YidB (DUF937 family)
MGLLDSLVGMLGGEKAGEAASGALVQHISELLSSNASGGGLSGLVQSFERAGLGNIIGSWIGRGQNLPISPEQLQQVLGAGKISQIAKSLGLQNDQVAAQLSQLLPHVIDRLTPNGQVPAGGVGTADILGSLSAILGKGAPPSSS